MTNQGHDYEENLARVAAARLVPTILTRSLIMILACAAALGLVLVLLGHPPGWTEMTFGLLLIAAVGFPVVYFTSLPLVTRTVAMEISKAANARFEGIAGQVQDGILIHDLNGVIVYGNSAVEQMHGFARGTLTGQRLEALIPKEMRSVLVEDLQAFQRTGKGRVIGQGPTEVEAQRRDGQRLQLEISVTPVLQGREVLLVVVLRDVTERKQAEREIARLARFPALSPSPVLECEADGTIRFANPAAERLLGAGTSVAGAGQWISGFAEHAQACRSHGQPIAGLESRVHGQTLLWVMQPGEAGRILVYGMDISQRKQAEEALRESEQKFRKLIEDLPVAVRIIRDERLVFGNAADARMFGYASPGEGLGSQAFDSIAEQDHERLREHTRSRPGGREAPRGYEATARRRDGSSFPVRIVATQIQFEAAPASLLVLYDLSDQKRLRMYEQILPVCCVCGKIRDDAGVQPGQGEWGRLDHYVMRHSDTQLSHTFCPPCFEQYRRQEGLG